MFVLVHLAAKSFGYDVVKLNQIWHQRLHWNVFDENYWKNLVLVHFTAAKSFGKVEPNLASTPSLECLRRKLLEESLI